MTTRDDGYFRDELLARRRHLEAVRRAVPVPEVESLLADIDAALDRLGHGSYHVCTVCHDDIGIDHLAEDPLARCCREHPSDAERARIDRDLALARAIQQGLLPPCCQAVDGWRLRYHYQPAAEVGGDFCDVIRLSAPHGTLVLVGDVSGKGIPASMLMSNLLGTFRSLASLGLPPGDLLGRVNDLFHEATPPGTFATLVAAVLKPDRTIDLYNAGHWLPLLRRDGSAAAVEIEPGLPLGAFSGSRYGPTHLATAPGETLLFFTDGVVEARNAAGEDFGAHRLASAFASGDVAELGSVIDQCVDEVQRFRQMAAVTDDALLFAVSAAEPSALGGARVA